MSEKQQRTAASMREKMLTRYGDGLSHKHNKNHNPYREHYKSHPVQSLNNFDEGDQQTNASTGLLRTFKLRKLRKRLDKGRFH